VPDVQCPGILYRAELLLPIFDPGEIELMIAGQAVDDDGSLETQAEARDLMRLLTDEALKTIVYYLVKQHSNMTKLFF
jgi:hypothetical protein